eukprot:g76501.t1
MRRTLPADVKEKIGLFFTEQVVEIAHGIAKTEHTYWLHQFACKVIKQMAEWGPPPDVAAFGLELEGGESKKQVHTSHEPEKTFIKRWQQKAVTSFSALGEASNDIKEKRVFADLEMPDPTEGEM